VDIHLLEWMESLLDMFPMSVVELQNTGIEHRLPILLHKLYELSVVEHI
jgi:hypothetical protein